MLQFDTTPADTRDPMIPPPAKGRDYLGECTTAYLDAQISAFEVKDYERQLRENAARLVDGDAWFEANDSSHPRIDEAIELRGSLIAHQRALEATHAFLLLRCWTACRSLYVLLQSLAPSTRDLWLVTEGSDELRAKDPYGIWKVLMGDRPAPGSWPAEEKELWVPRVEEWNRDFLSDRLTRWTGAEG